jgi:hypothetical protein
MEKLNLVEVTEYVEANIGTFHTKRLESLQRLKLTDVLARKNPYLFRAKNILTAHDLVKTILEAHLSSQEETIFGEFLEQLAIYICAMVYGGTKSSAEGIDLEFEREGTRYIAAIKSGPNWANSRQIAKLKDDFVRAKRVLRTNTSGSHVIAVNGCCYGRDDKPDKGEYLKLCGQRFWSFVSGSENLYTDIVEPLGHKAREKNDEFNEAFAQVVNLFTVEFSKGFCADSGSIDWQKLVQLNSQARDKQQQAK